MGHAKQLHNCRDLNDSREIINREGLPGNLKNDPCLAVQHAVITAGPAGYRTGLGRRIVHLELLAAQGMGQGREAAAFGIAQTQAAARELGFQDMIFLFEVRDDLLLMPIDPAGDGHDQELEYHGSFSGWRRR